MPASGGAGYPLAIALTPDGDIWINEEAHTQLKRVSGADPSTGQVIPIPQNAAGIFAADGNVPDQRTKTSVVAEDLEVDSDGSIWFTEGGGFFYGGVYANSSRIVHYTPSTGAFQCYNVPDDDAEAGGVLVDHAHGVVWYTELSLTHGNVIGSFTLGDAVSDCNWNPDSGVRTPVCGTVHTPGCHDRLVLPNPGSAPMQLAMDPAGAIWVSEYWGTRIGRIDPVTRQLTEYPLPPPIAKTGPGIYAGAGPFGMTFDASGDLWIAEEFDAKILRFRMSALATNDCQHLDAGGHNPCVDEMFAGSTGTDGISGDYVIKGADGLMWFGLNDNTNRVSRLGFIDTARGNAVALLPWRSDVQALSSMAWNAATGELWFGEYFDRRIGRLVLAAGDADGVRDNVNNCPGVYNPGQENADGDFVALPPGYTFGDLTWPNSDNLGDVCDPDADNDGLTNAEELASPGSPLPVGNRARPIR